MMAVRHIVEGSPAYVCKELSGPFKEWRVIGFQVTNVGWTNTAYVLIEIDERLARLPMEQLGDLVERE